MAFWEKNCKGLKIVFDTETLRPLQIIPITLLYIKITVTHG